MWILSFRYRTQKENRDVGSALYMSNGNVSGSTDKQITSTLPLAQLYSNSRLCTVHIKHFLCPVPKREYPHLTFHLQILLRQAQESGLGKLFHQATYDKKGKVACRNKMIILCFVFFALT